MSLSRDINKAWLSGVVVSQPTLTKLSSGTDLCIFTLEVIETWKKDGKPKHRSNFIQIEVLGKNAIRAHTLLSIGTRCELEGFLRQDKLQGESRTRVRAYSVHLEDTHDDEGSTGRDKVGGDPGI